MSQSRMQGSRSLPPEYREIVEAVKKRDFAAAARLETVLSSKEAEYAIKISRLLGNGLPRVIKSIINSSPSRIAVGYVAQYIKNAAKFYKLAHRIISRDEEAVKELMSLYFGFEPSIVRRGWHYAVTVKVERKVTGYVPVSGVEQVLKKAEARKRIGAALRDVAVYIAKSAAKGWEAAGVFFTESPEPTLVVLHPDGVTIRQRRYMERYKWSEMSKILEEYGVFEHDGPIIRVVDASIPLLVHRLARSLGYGIDVGDPTVVDAVDRFYVGFVPVYVTPRAYKVVVAPGTAVELPTKYEAIYLATILDVVNNEPNALRTPNIVASTEAEPIANAIIAAGGLKKITTPPFPLSVLRPAYTLLFITNDDYIVMHPDTFTIMYRNAKRIDLRDVGDLAKIAEKVHGPVKTGLEAYKTQDGVAVVGDGFAVLRLRVSR